MSKILLFSDSHLHPPIFKKAYFDRLVNLIEQADQVIINGDFWEGYFYSFDQFVNSKWNQLFPLLKQKHTIYLPGNHDLMSKLDKRTNLFSSAVVESYEFSSGGKNFICLHGNKYIESPSQNSLLMRNKFLLGLFYSIYYFGFWILGDNFWKIYEFENARLRMVQKKYFSDKTLITGHTHLAEISKNFINSGLMTFGFFQYIWIEDGQVRQYKERTSSVWQLIFGEEK
ncbi:MAG: hypothetical protein COU63_00535 [Candidatus Pacebacteria bacterium CG10_big_fil_rev_8_21_14_0_10_36_11]|nr:hypothetical protein [Candidatus Pacearchaeota archaeon]OIP74515.1 MAG: hypothetical protein AUK08_00130 [Candidatus Pacebacteria bacterium CG2_30_36_39]PIR65141.1 MAG: hypothetical protein COU63_00535 [Candidatus Pacebacteria bacterium CG10_big_fil_rev_8_21_14_0_10_36_11]PJC42825.1 MAG: hypothetical protein CO040_02425 [Candidatus Pacebacteria bacterium CG_4_9_14_0_2_um_filter_36_8]